MEHAILMSKSIEQELVLASISLDPAKDERICEILESMLDWPRLYRIATQHGIFPLFFRRLMAVGEKQIPPAECSRGREILQANTQNNLRLAWILVQFVDLLEDNGIDCVILKGPVFALQAYGDLSLRQYADLDILIHQKDFPRVYDLLVQSGYAPTFKLESKQKKFLVWSDNHFPFKRRGDEIEVHWEIAPQGNIYPITPEQMWQETKSVQIFEKEIRSLSLENTILFTCLHGAKHGWKQLKWIVDLAYFCQFFSENSWLTLFERAKSKGLLRQVYLGLLLAESLIDAALPSRVRELINADRHAQLLASQVRASMFKGANKLSLLEDYNFYLKTRERLRDRLYFLIDLIFIPKKPDWLMISLPEKMYILYYLFRPMRLLFIAGRAAFSALF